MPPGWSVVPDPNVPDAFQVLADRQGGDGLYTSNAQLVVYKLVGDFDPKEAITHGYVDSEKLANWQTTNASLADVLIDAAACTVRFARPGIRLDLTGYPLAFLPYNALRGLGIGATLDYMFWPPSRVCTSADKCGPDLATTEFRLEAGLRWHWNILNRRNMPSLLVNLQYGHHYFAISKVAKKYDPFTDPTPGGNNMTVTPDGLDSNGLPDIRYQYINIGVGARVPYFVNDRIFIGGVIDFNYHAVLSYGELESKFLDTSTVATLYQGGGYGPVSGGYGFRVGLTVAEVVPWKNLTIRLSGFYEVFAMGFQLGSQSAPQYQLPPTDDTQGRQGRAIDDA